MIENPLLPRRGFLQASIASLALVAAVPPPRPARAFLPRPSFLPQDTDALAIAVAARTGLDGAGERVPQRDVVGVADFRQHSRTPRLHLVDMTSGRVETLLVAHGRGSDPDKTGWVSRFSNAPGSEATCEGAFLTGDYYEGEHGRSMRLIGLDASNSNAESRAIVVHAAWYVGPEMIQTHGMLGRSEGCFAVSASDLSMVLGRLGPGHLLVAGMV
jgi:L,D-transpeptidase catalytic domain